MFGFVGFSDARQSETREGFEGVALPHMNRLFRTAARILGDRVLAEDVVQEVYLRAWKNFSRFQPGTNCLAWLFKIMFNTIHHHRRKWLKAEIFLEEETMLDQTLAYSSPIPEQIEDEDILAALDRLTNDYRAVVLLVDVDEFSYREVADILKIPIGTVMSRLSRARAQLRKGLADVAKSHGIGDSYGAPVQAQERSSLLPSARNGIFAAVPAFMQ